jgi:hypothetical protein
MSKNKKRIIKILRRFKKNTMFTVLKNAGVAQLAEQLICNQQVAGSSPITSSIFLQKRNFLTDIPKHNRL